MASSWGFVGFQLLELELELGWAAWVTVRCEGVHVGVWRALPFLTVAVLARLWE